MFICKYLIIGLLWLAFTLCARALTDGVGYVEETFCNWEGYAAMVLTVLVWPIMVLYFILGTYKEFNP